MHALLTEFESIVSARGDRPAVSDPLLALRYAELQALAAGLAQRITDATQRPHVAMMLPTSAAAAVAILAAWYAGKTIVPLNFLLPPEDLAFIIQDAEIDLVLTAPPLSEKLAALPIRTIILDKSSLTPGRTAAPPASGADTAVIIYTSGTAGRPKGVCLSFFNLLHNARACGDYARIAPDSVFVSVLPQFHSFGFTAMTVTPLLRGAEGHYLPRFAPVQLIETLAARRANVFMAVASMYAALAQMKQVPKGGLPHLSLAISGGEPLSMRVHELFKQRTGVDILQGYGLTEASPVVSLNTPWAHRLGSVGRPLPGVSVEAVDDAGRPLPHGQSGELVVRGHCVMQFYLRRPEETAATLRDGALFTGDVGHVDADGYIHVTGRAKEMLIVGGENVFPREIEAVLEDHPAVAEAAVIGRPDELRGEAPVAFVLLHPDASATPAELREFARQRLPGYKAPREVRIANELPRGPTGKVLRRALRAD